MFREKLLSGKAQLGVCIMYPSAGVVERIGADWDWVWIDGQHGQMGYQDTLALVRACDLVNRPALVRVPWLEAGHIGLVMDMNPAGVIVPCVDTPEQARAAVRAAKFPPLGGRSYGGRRPIDRKGRNYSDTANNDVLLIVQIESPEALNNADAIAAVDGVDGIFLGPDDVLLRRGVSPTAPRNAEILNQDLATVAKAFRKHKKFGVMVGANPEILRSSLEYGFHMIVAGGDVPFIATASAKASADARAIVDGHASTGKGQAPGNASGSPY